MPAQYLIASCYKFVALDDYAALKPILLEAMRVRAIKGTFVLAAEGINGTVCGDPEKVSDFFTVLRQDPRFNPLPYFETYDTDAPFSKAKVKLRNEIVTMGVAGLDPAQRTGTHLSPAEWNALLAEEDVLVIDTRNEYEVSLGSFKQAINPHTADFRNFPDYVEKHLLPHKDKKIAMCCTGGIRCEKSTAYLLELGFKAVYQLDGGILNYLKTVPADQSLWEGACFIFDDRLALDATLAKVPTGEVDPEWKHKVRQQTLNTTT